LGVGHHSRIYPEKPLTLKPFLPLTNASHIILPDPLGNNVEGPALHKPALSMCDVTDVGTIFGDTARLLCYPVAYHALSVRKNPFGDGTAAEQIVSILKSISVLD
jgi:UDP-N-acetylglucosamine 2-epimerase